MWAFLSGTAGPASALLLLNPFPAQALQAPGASPPSLSSTTTAELHRELGDLADSGAFSGVVLLAVGREVSFLEGYGAADREGDRHITSDTRFNVGSLGKSFTSAGILRLVQEGRLSLDDPVGLHLTGLPSGIGDRVTIGHLLRMRSGMGDYLMDPEFQANPDRFRTTEALLALVASRPLEFSPGSQSSYSNSGFVVLGAVIEALEGQPYHDVMREWFFEPLGMAATGPEGPEATSNTAFGYSAGPQGTGPLRRCPPAPATPAGGVYSTASDLHRFFLALLSDELLDPELTDLFLNIFEPDPAPAIRETGRLARAGGAPGVGAVVLGEPTTLDLVIVLSNRSFGANGVASALWDRRTRLQDPALADPEEHAPERWAKRPARCIPEPAPPHGLAHRVASTFRMRMRATPATS